MTVHMNTEHIAVELTTTQRKNLKRLAAYLLNGLKARFDMAHYTQWGSYGQATEKAMVNDKINCGTVGCAAGHGPHAGIPKAKEESWTEYVQRAFTGKEIDGENDIWQWCFHDNWKEVDNTPRGAARRILYMLKYGIPENHKEQRRGEEPFSYVGI